MFETFRETWGLRMFMGGSLALVMSDHPGRTRSTAGLASALAAVFPEVVGERAKGVVVGAVEDVLPIAPRAEEPGARQAFEVVAQCGPGDVELLLDHPHGRPVCVALD